jgi:anti-sigma regulatory factor (Ser/Thr protein kinase)
MRDTVDRMDLPSRPSSAAAARRFVDRALRRLGVPAPEIGTLLASEVVTNAVLYSDGRIVIEVEPVEGAVRVSVTDESPRPARPRDVAPDATSGRGLGIVSALARAWGVEDKGISGKLVWFEVAR